MRAAKILLVLLIIVVLAASAMQRATHRPREAPLKGFFKLKENPGARMFTWRKWFASEFQESYSSRLEDNIGFRNTFVRVNNQWNYSLFGLINARGFVQGRDRYLYEEDYLHEYNGDYFIGRAAIDRKLSRLKNVTDSLRAHGVPLLLVYEPGKASFYPEYIPSRFHPGKRGPANFDYYIRRSSEIGLNYIDLNSWFLRMKDTSGYPLFPRYGMHWSLYGVTFAVDTLCRAITKITGTQLPAARTIRVEKSETPRGTDNDIGELLNLACMPGKTPGAYPVITFEPTVQPSLNVLVIADSYYINIVEEYGRKLFRSQDYWYYNKKVYPYQNNDPPVYVDKTDLKRKLLKYDLVLLMTSEINLHCGFWNFADEAFAAFHPEHRDPLVYAIENDIRNEREWFRFMVGKARLQGKPLEEMVRGDAMYTFCTNYDNLRGKSPIDTVYHIICDIRNSPEWYAQVEKKARDMNISIDSMMLLDAIYSYDQSKKKH